MGCTGSVAKENSGFGYVPKETLYYKVRDKNQPVQCQLVEEPPKKDIIQMVSENLSSENSESDSSDHEDQKENLFKEGKHSENSNNIIDKHKPKKESKLKLQSSYTTSDKNDKEK